MLVLLFPIEGSDVLEGAVEPRRVVPGDPLEDRPAGLGPVREDPPLEALALERLSRKLMQRGVLTLGGR